MNRLTINPTKTKFLLFSSQNKSSLCIPPISIGNHLLSASEECTYLGVIIDCNLKFQHHITHIKKKLSYGIRILIRSRPFFSRPVLLSLYFAFVHSHINYCITSWGNTYSTHLKPLQTIQNQAIRVITSNPHTANAKQLLQENNILDVAALVKFNLATFLFKLINDKITLSLFPMSSLTNTNPTRFALHNNFILPKVRTNYGKQTVHFAAISSWNTLPFVIKLQKAHRFCHELKNFLLCDMYVT